MSGKRSKKIRQYYRRELSQRARDYGELIGNAMKPKPKFIPMWLWIWGAKIFIKVK